MSQFTNFQKNIKNGNFKLSFASDEYDNSKDLPFFVYLQHWDTKLYYFVEINEQYILQHFNNVKDVTKADIIRRLNDDNYSIILESPNKINIFKELKIRYEALLTSRKELDVVSKLFKDNPEYLI